MRTSVFTLYLLAIRKDYCEGLNNSNKQNPGEKGIKQRKMDEK